MEKDIDIMTEDWVNEVFERGRHENTHARDLQFMKHKCPALKGLNISVSQMNRKDKEALKRKIEMHGGVYSGILDMEKTTTLIIPVAEGDKYDYARKWKIPCLRADWVLDSIDKGVCLATSPYRVEATKTSSPSKGGAAGKLTEVSMCSTICAPPESELTMTKKINETAIGAGANATMLGPLMMEQKSTEALLEKLQISRVRKAGHFLEGCRIFLSGFTEQQETQLQRVLQASGAARMNQITSSVTHVVIDQKVPEHFSLMRQLNLSPAKVRLQWIVESMQSGRPLPEEEFAFKEATASAAGKSTRRSSKRSEDPPEASEQEQLTMFENDLLSQYDKKGPESEEKKKSEDGGDAEDADDTVQFKQAPIDGGGEDSRLTVASVTSQSMTQVERFLSGKNLALIGFDDEREGNLSDWVGEAGGELVFRNFE